MSRLQTLETVAEMTDLRPRLSAAAHDDCLNPPWMDALATFAAKQKRGFA